MTRKPSEETIGLYPGLVVCDDRVTGSITLGSSRFPLWAIPRDFNIQTHTDEPDAYGVSDDDLERFAGNLFQLRGEFARLLLVLAYAERLDRSGAGWWETQRHRRRVSAQLRRCLATLEEGA